MLDSVLAAHLDNPELRYLVQEYHDGLLLYEISKTQIWDPAKADTKALDTSATTVLATHGTSRTSRASYCRLRTRRR